MAKLEKLVEGAQPHMEPDEKAAAAVLGTYETKKMGQDWTRSGVMIATDRRVLFFAKKLGGFDIESFPYSNISSIEHSKGFMGHAISLFASGNSVRMKWIKDGTIDDFVSTVRGRLGKSPVAENAPVPDAIEQVKKLADLRDQGILSEEEFQAKKKQLLGLD